MALAICSSIWATVIDCEGEGVAAAVAEDEAATTCSVAFIPAASWPGAWQ